MTDAQSIPFTRNPASVAKEAQVRDSVRQAVSMATEAENSRLAQPDDAAKLYQMLIDPAVHAPIYTLPQPLTVASVRAFIERHLDERERGEGLLFLNLTADGAIAGYTDLQIWPEWAAGELGGAVHPKRQGERRGVLGAQLGFAWMFEALELELLCETAALDNDRTAKLLDHLGLERMGQTESVKADGTKRASLVWEISRDDWLDKHPAEEN